MTYSLSNKFAKKLLQTDNSRSSYRRRCSHMFFFGTQCRTSDTLNLQEQTQLTAFLNVETTMIFV